MPHSRNKFSFLHTYEATGHYWQGLKKAGLVRSGCGVRLISPSWAEDDHTFDCVARRGGELYKIISERKCPLVVDRILGGSPYHPRKYDQSLVREYADLLGEDFIGGQVHETICNIINDWSRFVRVDPAYAAVAGVVPFGLDAPNHDVKPIGKAIDPDVIRSFFDWSSDAKWLEYGTLENYRGKTFPANKSEFNQIVAQELSKHGAKFGNHFCYCEGRHGGLNWHHAYKNGAGWCFAEVGPWASMHTQFMIAALRGAAKSARKPWGIFYAPWGPDGCTCFIEPAMNSWKMDLSELEGSNWPIGPDKGPSTALQRRSFFHAYLSGAHTIHEEWGAESNLLDWDSGELSSYGVVTRELLDFVESYPDVGEPYTPVALVLDATISPPVNVSRSPFGHSVCGFYTPEPQDIAWAQIKLGLYGFGCASKGSDQYDWAGMGEAYCYSPCELPEIFDIVPSDAPDKVWESYRKVIAIGDGEDAPPQAERYPLHAQIDAVISALRDCSPFLRTSDMPMQINYRRSDGAWIIGLYNPKGARRGDPYGLGSILNESFAAQEVLKPSFHIRDVRVLYSWPNGKLKVNGDEIHITVGPGGVMIIEVSSC